MDKLKWILGFIVVMTILILFSVDNSKTADLKQARFNLCITEMQKAVPDPNDTGSRASFLRDCYEK